jgi:sulfotransferase family protein
VSWLTQAERATLRFIHSHSGKRLSQLDIACGLQTLAQRHDDLFVVTYPKSGTTLVQMMLYQLLTDGCLAELTHIGEWSPYLEGALDAGRDVDAWPAPRVIKTHLHYRQMRNRAGRFLYVARNVADVAVSFYAHYRAYRDFMGSFDDFFELFLKGQVAYGSWFSHVEPWWRARTDPSVLFLTYEDLRRDLPGSVRRVAAFCGVTLEEFKLARVVESCSFEHMRAHEEKFDPRLEYAIHRRPRAKRGDFIRKGEVGAGRNRLSETQTAALRSALLEQATDTTFPSELLP